LNLTPEYVRTVDTLPPPKIEDQTAMDRHYVALMCMPYRPMPDDRDMFVWYSDIGVLSGSAGYLRIRDGYVYDRRVVIRS
jgi:hypothetical protein